MEAKETKKICSIEIKNYIKFIFFGVLLIDIINGITQGVFSIHTPIGVITRSAIFLMTFQYIFKQRKSILKTLIIILVCGFIFLVPLWLIYNQYDIKLEILETVKIIYSYSILSFFIYYRNYIAIDKLLTYVVNYGVLVAIILIISLYTNFNPNGTDYTFGTQGPFIAGNDLGLTLVFALGISLIVFFENKTFKNLVCSIVISLGLCLIGTRTGILGVAILWLSSILYVILAKDSTIKIGYINKLILVCITSLLFILAVIKISELLENQSDYYKDKMTVEAATGARTILIDGAKDQIKSFNGLSFLIGKGKSSAYANNATYVGSTETETRSIEADFYDTIASYGYLFGAILLIIPISMLITGIKLFLIKQKFRLFICCELMFLYIIVGYIAGHAILNMMLAPLLSVSYILILQQNRSIRNRTYLNNNTDILNNNTQ